MAPAARSYPRDRSEIPGYGPRRGGSTVGLMDVGAATQASVDAQADGNESPLIELEAVARRYRVGDVTVTALGPVRIAG